MEYSAQAYFSNSDVLIPDEITSSDGEYEKQLKLTQLVSDQYFAYKGNYSGNTKFDIEHGSKNCKK